MAKHEHGSLTEVALLFLRLGIVGFGGPLAHIALLEDEAVKKRGWLDKQTFNDLLAATNLIPGPNSTEMAIHVGFWRAGVLGAILAGGMFILPAFLLMLIFSWAYLQFGSQPQVASFLYGVKPAVIAIILVTLIRLARTAIKDFWLALLAVGALLVALLLPGWETYALLAAGGLGLFTLLISRPVRTLGLAIPLLFAELPYLPLLLSMLKVGALLFGGGLVIVPLLQAEVVSNHHWLTQQQLLDGVALGQATPGPVVIVATFVGYIVGGWVGAIIATLGIFLPAFVFVLLTAPIMRAFRSNAWVRAFLNAVGAAVVGVILASVFTLADSAMVNIHAQNLEMARLAAGFIGAAAFLAAYRYKVGTIWLILGSGVVGVIFRLFVPLSQRG